MVRADGDDHADDDDVAVAGGKSDCEREYVWVLFYFSISLIRCLCVFFFILRRTVVLCSFLISADGFIFPTSFSCARAGARWKVIKIKQELESIFHSDVLLLLPHKNELGWDNELR